MEKIKAYLELAFQFFREVKAELQKVTFPTRQETVGSTIVVLILTTVVATYLGLSDMVLAWIVKRLLQAG